MSNTITSANMSLPVPIVGVDTGPDYANNIDACLVLIDAHTHNAGNGIPITPSGLNISSDLNFQSNNAYNLRSSRYTSQSAVLSVASDIGCVYVVGNELYYNDVTGNHNVKLTNNGSVNAGAGSITGLPSGTASASFAAGTFVWQSATNTSAVMDAGSVILRNSTANSHGLTLSCPSALAADYPLILPLLPAATSFVALDSSGNMSSTIAVLGALTTANLSSSAGILGSQLSSSAGIVGGQITSALTLSGSLAVTTTLNVTGTTTAAAVNATAITASTNTMTVGTKNVVASSVNATAGLNIVRAAFDASGSITSGEGLAAVTPSSTGTFQIVWSHAFSDVPVIVCTTAAGGTPTAIDIISIAPDQAFITTGSSHVPVNIIAIGQR